MTPLFAQRARADRQFERLYRRHAGDVYRYALAVLRNPTDAEDVTQTTFLNAYRAYAGGARADTPRNWLIAIAHNVCRQRFRQAARRPSEVELNEELAGTAVPEERVGVQDIQRALGHLAFNQRAALVMRELEGRSYAEIAAALDVSVAAVETLIFRARRSLREQLEGTLTCSDAERAISKQLDGALPRDERAQLRGHLRECAPCSSIARRLRAQRGAWKALGAIPLPGTLTGLFGGGGATTATGAGVLGGGVAVKAAAVVATAVVASGTVYGGKKLVAEPAHRTEAAALSTAPAAAARRETPRAGPASKPSQGIAPASRSHAAGAPSSVGRDEPRGGPTAKPPKLSPGPVGQGPPAPRTTPPGAAPGEATAPARENRTAPEPSAKKPKPARSRSAEKAKPKQKPKGAPNDAAVAESAAEPGNGNGNANGNAEKGPNGNGIAGGNENGRGEPDAVVATAPAAETPAGDQDPPGNGAANGSGDDGGANGNGAGKK
jgi:RNA polymerase sigma factor (sigma-70 family)